MRSLLVLVAPVLLSFGVIACGEDESESRPQAQATQQQSELVAAGGGCDRNDDCEEGLACEVATTRTIGVKGEPMMDPCEIDPKAAGCAQPKGKPTTDPAPSTPTGAPTNDPVADPAPAPLAKRVCTAR